MNKEASVIGFNYYAGIADSYRNTESDPYYYPNENKRKMWAREDWDNEKLVPKNR